MTSIKWHNGYRFWDKITILSTLSGFKRLGVTTLPPVLNTLSDAQLVAHAKNIFWQCWQNKKKRGCWIFHHSRGFDFTSGHGSNKYWVHSSSIFCLMLLALFVDVVVLAWLHVSISDNFLFLFAGATTCWLVSELSIEVGATDSYIFLATTSLQ